ncbi:hypothetical protein AYI68_g990 [Smittium mucronatum]|uniref:Uncharacterized protein n=1 Tax=Smittium mucronatum TaxID=133383 RepID=A0A1R0H6N4_9FUNG|nr:hypothetical protein AYI68_g990 [Smittium mucronatum]
MKFGEMLVSRSEPFDRYLEFLVGLNPKGKKITAENGCSQNAHFSYCDTVDSNVFRFQGDVLEVLNMMDKCRISPSFNTFELVIDWITKNPFQSVLEIVEFFRKKFPLSQSPPTSRILITWITLIDPKFVWSKMNQIPEIPGVSDLNKGAVYNLVEQLVNTGHPELGLLEVLINFLIGFQNDKEGCYSTLFNSEDVGISTKLHRPCYLIAGYYNNILGNNTAIGNATQSSGQIGSMDVLQKRGEYWMRISDIAKKEESRKPLYK